MSFPLYIYIYIYICCIISCRGTVNSVGFEEKRGLPFSGNMTGLDGRTAMKCMLGLDMLMRWLTSGQENRLSEGQIRQLKFVLLAYFVLYLLYPHG